MGLVKKEFKTYATILADGTIRVQASENDAGAVRRDYELKDGTKGTKYEFVFNELSGIITDIQFKDGDFGRQMNLTVKDDEEIVLSMGVNSNYAMDIMKKLPNISISQEVTFGPYSFKNKETGKPVKGVTLVQGMDKIKNAFWDEVNNKAKDGFPVPEEGKKLDSDDWQIYFKTVSKFLQRFTEENIIPALPKTIADNYGGKIVEQDEVSFEDEK